MGLTITEDITLEDIDEAIKHAYTMLKTDHFGNRMTHQKKQILQNSIDDLLDARLNLQQRGSAFPND